MNTDRNAFFNRSPARLGHSDCANRLAYLIDCENLKNESHKSVYINLVALWGCQFFEPPLFVALWGVSSSHKLEAIIVRAPPPRAIIRWWVALRGGFKGVGIEDGGRGWDFPPVVSLFCEKSTSQLGDEGSYLFVQRSIGSLVGGNPMIGINLNRIIWQIRGWTVLDYDFFLYKGYWKIVRRCLDESSK